MRNLLDTLRRARTSKAWLEEQIRTVEAPHLEAAAQASRGLRAALKAAAGAEDTANAEAKAAYLGDLEARHARLLEGSEAPAIDLPPGWIVQLRAAVEITEASAVPRALCAPVKKLVTEALKAGPVPGVEKKTTPVFIFRSTPAPK